MAVWHSKYWFWNTLYLYLKYFVHGHPLEPWKVKCVSTAQPVLCLLFRDGGISALLQLLLCYNQIMIIVSLCLDEGRSLISKLFNSNLMQLLGRISMSLYLIHDPLIFYLQFLFNGKTFDISIWIYNMLSKHSCLWFRNSVRSLELEKWCWRTKISNLDYAHLHNDFPDICHFVVHLFRRAM